MSGAAATSSESSGTGAAPKELLVGGQAVMEGVMMKLPRAWAVTVRRMSGELVTRSGPFKPWSDRWPILKLPILRGIAVLFSTLALGMRSLFFSSDIMAEDMEALEKEESDKGESGKGRAGLMALSALMSLSLLNADLGGSEHEEGADEEAPEPEAKREEKKGGLSTTEIVLTIAFTVVLGISMFKLLPLLVARGAALLWEPLADPLAESIISGIALLCVFVGYLFFISLQRDIKRVFQYHGAEHKVVWVMEKGQEPTLENARPHSTFHPRCGTSFLFFMVLTSIFIWALFPVPWGIMGKLALRIALFPLIIGISYELIRLTARHQESPLFRAMIAPGLWSQRITTKQPDDGMLEVAYNSLALAEAVQDGRQASVN